MMAAKGIRLMLLCVGSMVASSTPGEQCRSVRVANVKSIFSIAPSPVGANVLFYGSAESAEGEIVTGKLFKLRLDATESDAVRLKTPDASNPSPPVWRPDGSSAYFETDEGIYLLSPPGGTPELFWKGPSAGLAISPDGLLLAFWRLEKGADTLVLYDIHKKSEARTWPVPDRFESDKAGWDVVFAPDGHALYARTYDELSTTPLKRFDIDSGQVSIVIPNCYAVAGARGAVYSIAVSGAMRSLRKIATTTIHSDLEVKDFGYDTLSRGGNPRWLISQDYRSREIAIFDTETTSVKKIGKYDSAAVLSDGQILQVKGSDITVVESACKPKELGAK